jgi:hypothetical protein
VQLRGAGDWHDPGLLGEQPSQRVLLRGVEERDAWFESGPISAMAGRLSIEAP